MNTAPVSVAKVTVFCAVWHRDARRHDLLMAHHENLRRQTMPVEVVYVFDGGDAPPPELEARTIALNVPLTIYEAWNMALAAVTTPLVMNLNLDDRLAPDAVERLAAHQAETGAVLVGGDWRICLSQAETDAVTPCGAAAELAFDPDCPPAARPGHRLGSGTGERLTFGPATLWTMGAHAVVPRYPWRLQDGSRIRSVGDGIFWSVLAQAGARLVRLPQIIGNYHFHPGEQAQYRVQEDLGRMMPQVMKI